MKEMIFDNRADAGRQLATALSARRYNHPLVVLGIPRGGVLVAKEVAEAFGAPLDVIIARKLRAPHQPELGIGAIVDGNHICILNKELVGMVGATQDYLDREIAYQKEEVERRLNFYRRGRPAPEVSGKTVLVIDDGVATGYTFRAALEGLRRRTPAKLVGAAPVAAHDSAGMLKPYADELIFLSTPVAFYAVGAWYQNFDQVSDEEVARVLHRNWSRFETKDPGAA
jgi:putative phosphoribosyl transferase